MIHSIHKNPLYQQHAFINGRWTDSVSHSHFEVMNPFDNSMIGKVVNCNDQDARRAIVGAHHAMKKWSQKTGRERAAVLMKWHQITLKHVDDLAEILTAEQGKPIAEAKAEILGNAGFLEWFAEEGKRCYGDIIPSYRQDRQLHITKVPVGVVAAITPWNFPFGMIYRKVAPALAAGCAMVLKPAPETPLTALAIANLAERAGLPPGLFNVLPSMQTETVGKELTSHALVKKLTFTGSTAVGKLLLQQCASTVKNVSLELGGNASLIVAKDADLKQPIDGIIASKFRNNGQTCICANRIIVHDSLIDALIKHLVNRLSSMPPGNGLDIKTSLGPLINNHAVKKMERLKGEAVKLGAQVVWSGDRIFEYEGNAFPATIVRNVPINAALYREEIFGPIAALYTYENDADAIAMANDTEYGLAAYIYTQDLKKAHHLSRQLDVGMVGINEVDITDPSIPFGGVKESGLGREGSKYGLDEYLETKYLCFGDMAMDKEYA